MKRGFTLVELIISLVVIGILMTIGYKGYNNITMNTKATQLLDQLGQIKAGMATYYKDMGTYPVNLAYLLRKPNPDNNDIGYDAFSLAAGDEEDTVLPEYWGGPYIDGMVEDPDQHGCLKAKTGGSICFGSSIASNADYSNPGLVMSAPPTAGSDNATGSPSMNEGPSALQEAGTGGNITSGNFYNVLSINRVPKDMAKRILIKGNNGETPTNNGNLVDVSLGYSDQDGQRVKNNWIIGVPSSANYSKSNRIIFKYSMPY